MSRMPVSLRRLAGVIIAVAVMVGSGSQWIVLQSAAWVGMIVVYAQDRPLAEAVADTLDGQHPCSLCKAIAEVKKGEAENPDGKVPAAQKAAEKLWACPGSTFVLCQRPPAEKILFTDTGRKGMARREAPPVPPPRMA